MEQSIQRGSTL